MRQFLQYLLKAFQKKSGAEKVRTRFFYLAMGNRET